MSLLLIARARGLAAKVVLAFAVAILVALASAEVAVSLRSPSDRAVTSPVLDSGILIGLCAPVAVLTWLIEDRLAWMSVTGCRDLRLIRLRWFLALLVCAVASAALLAEVIPHQQSRVLIVADFSLLFGLGLLCAVTCGARLGWLAPAGTALGCSTPGLLPLAVNWPVRADHTGAVVAVATICTLAGGVLYVLLDDYGFARSHRLLGRMPGVTDE